MQDKKKFYIDGKWVDPKKKNDFNVINPSTEESCAVISLGSAEDINTAVNAAKKAFESWAFTSKEERIKLLESLYSLYKKRWAEMAEAISLEMGAPIDFSTKLQAGTGASHIKSYIKVLKDYKFEKILGDHAPNNKILYEPKGVCALITPWNWPMNQVCLKVIPALATGCTMVLKPSEIAPLSSMLLAEMIDEVKFPAGVFNLVNGDGAVAGNALTSHPDVNMISFTGSTRAGALISKNAANDFKRVSLELGGKGANIIFKDADPEAIERGALRCFRNSGQSCNAPTRMLVEKSMYDEAVERLKKYTESFEAGDPKKEGVHIGPVISETQYDKIQVLIQKGIDEGAKLVAGGIGKPDGLNKGYFVKPTVFADVNNDMEVARTEIFGPVLSVIPFETEEEAIKIANWLNEFEVTWFEDPIDNDDIDSLIHVSNNSPVRIIAGEGFDDHKDFTRFVSSNATDIVNPEVMRIGGISGAVKVAGICSSFDAELAFHNAESPLKTMTYA